MPLIINGQRVDDAVLENEFSQIKAYYENLGNVSCCERDPEFRGYAKDNIVARVLLSQEAARTMEPSPAAEVEAAFEKLKQDYGGEEWFFARTGATAEQVDLIRRDVDVDLRVKRMLEQIAERAGVPSEADLRAFYEKHIDLFKTEEEVKVFHILKNPTRGEDRPKAFEELREVRKRAQAGEDFVALARAHSDRGEENMDLGYFKRGELMQEFETVAFSLDAGEISPIFLSSYGYHLAKLIDRKPAVPKPFEEVRDEVELRVREERKNELTRELVDRLKLTAKVEELAEEEAAV